jgi:hypothetical protein
LVEAAICRVRKEIGEEKFLRALAEHWLERGSETWIGNRVKELIESIIGQVRDYIGECAPIGSAQKQSQDGGGWIGQALDEYVVAMRNAFPDHPDPTIPSEKTAKIIIELSDLPLNPERRQAWYWIWPRVSEAIHELAFSMSAGRLYNRAIIAVKEALEEFDLLSEEPRKQPNQNRESEQKEEL